MTVPAAHGSQSVRPAASIVFPAGPTYPSEHTHLRRGGGGGGGGRVGDRNQ